MRRLRDRHVRGVKWKAIVRFLSMISLIIFKRNVKKKKERYKRISKHICKARTLKYVN